MEHRTYSFEVGKRTADFKVSCFSKRKLMGACHKDTEVSLKGLPLAKSDSVINRIIKGRNE